MPASPTKFKAELLETVHDLLWRQWSSLGAGLSEAGEPRAGHVIDPEALLLATTFFGRRETRLFDEALDWLTHYGSLINLQRLKNLHTGSGLGEASVLHATAAFVQRHGKLPKWGALAKAGVDGPKATPEPFFITNGSSRSHWGKTDPDFLAHGWLRSAPRLRGLVMPPASAKTANALLTLRSLIGVSSRCEIILCLLARPSASAAELARLTGYAAQSVQSVLGEMVLSGRLHMDGGRSAAQRDAPVRGKSKRYSLHRPDWSLVLQIESSPRWLPWPAILVIAQKTLECLTAASADNTVLLTMQLRRVLESHAADLAEGGTASHLGFHPGMTGDELLNTLAARLPAMLRDL